ncbi:glucose 1-dehydrogenase [Leuconostoc citreum]|uniref:glucose 1-dehydrogenase n=1 Tax=Leuconostoc citreum TaxID=33964 RepID=UPI000246609E|nr:glucose 1-dehydrogenase [Leuconostoc citreum]MCS8587205.1 SDR family NAD(P)-dependent oxidoreductase [Leuconostoc citreum]MCS8595391.1 SDR family NAD(P)-dependent oxidoreductase [Leuconostoc citreum]MCS8600104.1 SDR family NAD(P)-dependent oxidoreductase [Leuconostoc citreum]CCF24278.1 Acetoin(Diacetyl) reductase [Leuconostoc citreum LBAE C10]
MSDKVAIVTGGGQGIGAGIAERLAHDGYAVIVNGRTKSKLDSVVAHITAQGGQAVSFVGDVQSRQVNIDMVQFAMTTYGRLDVFVANAGIDWVDSIEETPEAEVDNVLNINLKSQIWALQAAPSAMRKNGSAGGNIILASSIAGMEGFELLGVYSATKFATRGLVQAAAKELAADNIRVNAYNPGIVLTPMWDEIDARFAERKNVPLGATRQSFIDGILLGRGEEPEDIAKYVSFLVSDQGDYITGQSLAVDGGIKFQ